jgi:predicted chitinase
VVSKAIDYGLSIVGAPYVWWLDGPVPSGSPAWAVNEAPPPPEKVVAEGCFCAGVPNLMLRAVGKSIPTLGDELYDGGCLAYGEYYSDVAEPFEIDEDYPEGTLIGRYFTWERSAKGDQGHVAVVLEDGYLLQSYDGDGNGYPGVNTDAHISDSHAGYFYEYAVRPWNWLGQEEEVSDLALSGDSETVVYETVGSETDVSLEQLQAIMPGLPYAEYLPHLNEAMAEAEITTPLRQAAFLAQLAHESGELQWFEEFADGWDYEGREDLGNVYEGDGPRYKGRGPIQLTGRANYTAASESLGLDLVNDPWQVATPEVGFRTACWFWTSHDLNADADVDDFDSICLSVNGGWNGYQERWAYYSVACKVLGA